MSINVKLLDQVKAVVDQIADLDVSHTELGTLGFEEAQKTIDEIQVSMFNLVGRIETRVSEVHGLLTNEAMEAVMAQLIVVKEQATEIGKLAEAVTKTPDYEKRRNHLISALSQIYDAIRRLVRPVEIDLTLIELREAISTGDSRSKIEKWIKELSNTVEVADQDAKKVHAALEPVRSKSGETGVGIASSGFNTHNHGPQENGLSLVRRDFGIRRANHLGGLFCSQRAAAIG